jgi:hypothetical protein
MGPHHRPLLESLEERCTPATWGNPWPLPGSLTLSFAPDGTAVGPYRSNLFQVLDRSYAGTAAWQGEVLRAFQAWADAANVHISLVVDDGSPFGTDTVPQGSPSFGDIRIGGVPLSPDVVSIAAPFDPSAGTWSGDILLNTTQPFGSDQPDYDLYSVLLHEAAHTLGLADNDDRTSSVYATYHGKANGLGATDLDAIQALYGSRPADELAETTGAGLSAGAADGLLAPAAPPGHSFETAGPLDRPLPLTSPLHEVFRARGEIHSREGADYYRITVPPQGAGPRMMTVGVWLPHPDPLALTLTLYNEQRQMAEVEVLRQGGTNVVQIPDALPGTTWYLRVSGEEGTPYLLDVDFSSVPVQREPLAQGTLTPTEGMRTATLQVAQSQLVHLWFSVGSASASSAAGVGMILTSADGHSQGLLLARTGETATTTVLLTSGTYTLHFTAMPSAGEPLPVLDYELSWNILSAPIGPYAEEGPAGAVWSTALAPPEPAAGRPPLVANAAPLGIHEPIGPPNWGGPLGAASLVLRTLPSQSSGSEVAAAGDAPGRSPPPGEPSPPAPGSEAGLPSAAQAGEPVLPEDHPQPPGAEEHAASGAQTMTHLIPEQTLLDVLRAVLVPDIVVVAAFQRVPLRRHGRLIARREVPE